MPAEEDPAAAARALYLDLLKRALLGRLEEDPADATFGEAGPDFTRKPFDWALRREGRDWPSRAPTMIGLARLENLQSCVEDALARGVPGDLIECGVWRGGATIFMRGLLAAWGDPDRRVWVADSFRGFPPPADCAPMAVPLAAVRAAFERYGLLDERVRFLPGWFRDTLPGAPIERLAVLRLDGDLYGSTMDALAALYPRLSPGGYAIVDDYALEGCRAAVDEYRRANGIDEEVRTIDAFGAFWRKS